MNTKNKTDRKWLAIAAAVLFCTQSVTYADSITWVGGSTGTGTGAWATASDWSGGKVPAAGDTVAVNTGTVDLGASTASFLGTISVSDAKFTSTATDGKNFIFKSGALTINQSTALAETDWNFNSGVARLFMGIESNQSYNLTLSGYAKMKAEHSTGAVRLATAWTDQTGGNNSNLSASLTVEDNAQLQIGRLYLGDRGNETNVATLTIKDNGEAKFTKTTGENCLILGYQGAKGIINLQDNGALTASGPVSFGKDGSGVGQMNQSGGSATFNSSVDLNYSSSIDVTGGTINLKGVLTVGSEARFLVGPAGTANFSTVPVGTITNNGTTNFITNGLSVASGQKLTVNGTGSTNFKVAVDVQGTLVLNSPTTSTVVDTLITASSVKQDAPGTIIINNNFTGASGSQLYVARDGATAAAPAYGALYIKSGTVSVDYIQLAKANNYSYIDISGGTVKVTNDIRIARNGTATGQMTAGTVTSANFILGFEGTGANGSFDLKGGTINATTELDVGRQGTGMFNVSGSASGTILKTPTINLALSGASSKGTMNQTGGTVDVSKNVTVGKEGAGVLNISGTKAGTVFKTAGSMLVSDTGTSSTGIVHISGGSVTVAGNIIVGQYSNSSLNSLTVSGTSQTTQLTAGNIYIGGAKDNANKGRGSLTLSGGVISGLFDFYVGANGTGEFTQTGGSLSTQYFCMGFAATGVGDWTMTGGTLNVSTNLRIGLNGVASATLAGGTITAGSLFQTSSSTLEFCSTVDGFTLVNATNATLAGKISMDSTETFSSFGSLSQILLKATGTYNNSATLVGNQFFDLVSNDSDKTLSAQLKSGLGLYSSYGAIAIESPTNSLELELIGLEDVADMADFLQFLNDPENKAQKEAWTATATEDGNVLISNLNLDAGDSFLYNFANYMTPSGGTVSMSMNGVPEPASWALLLLGAFSIGLATARRKTKQTPFA